MKRSELGDGPAQIEGEPVPIDVADRPPDRPGGLWAASRWRPTLVALSGYSLAVAVLARGLLPALNSSIIGPIDGDNFWYAWSVWWFKQAVQSGRDPNYTHLLRALDPSVPVFTDGLFNQLIAVPLQAVLTPLGAYNVTILLSFVLSGLTMYLLATAFTRNWIACFIAGLVFSFSTYHFARASVHLGVMTLQLLPFCAWRVILMVRTPTLRNALLAGLGVGLVPYSTLYYVAYFLVPAGIGLIVAIAAADRMWFVRRRNVMLGALTLAVAAVVAAPAVLPELLAPQDIQAAIASQAGMGAKVSLSADVVGYVLPDPYNLVGPWLAGLFGTQNVFPVRSVFLGYPLLGLSLVALVVPGRHRRLAWAWTAFAVAGVVLSFGPQMLVRGKPVAPLPFYDLLFRLPGLQDFRAPGELAVLPLLALSVAAALGVDRLACFLPRDPTRRQAAYCLLLVLVVIGMVPNPPFGERIKSIPVKIPELYDQIEASNDHGLLLDVPTYIASAQFMQTVHDRPIVGGILPRNPADSLTAVDEVPYLAQLNSWSGMPPSDVAPDASSVDVLPLPRFLDGLRSHGISWVVLHQRLCLDPVETPYYCPKMPRYSSLLRFLTNTLGHPFYSGRGDGLTAWHVVGRTASWADAPEFQVGPGWAYGLLTSKQGRRRVMGPEAKVYVDAPSGGSLDLRLRAAAYDRPASMKVDLNGQLLRVTPLTTNRPEELDLGGVRLHRGRNTLDLSSLSGCASGPSCNTFSLYRLDFQGWKADGGLPSGASG